MNMKKVEREVNGIIYLIELYRDEEHPEKNRYVFEGEGYTRIIRTPKPVPGPPAEPKPTIYENIEETLRIVKTIKEKVEKLKA